MPDLHWTMRQTEAGREAIRIIETLVDAGFVAYFAGGCVRDAMLGRSPKDFDVATDATPAAVRRVFGKRRTIAFGESFGVIGVLPPTPRRPSGETPPSTESVDSRQPDSEAPQRHPTEVATFRADGTYSDGRRPDAVTYGDARADAGRRDFTINGMFFDPLEDRVIDYVGGQKDLQAKRLRTIGDAWQRFDEDKLRMLRAIRFATTLRFDLDPATRDAITQHAETIRVVSGERIGAEMRRVLAAPTADFGLRELCDTDLATQVWPGLSEMPWQEFRQRWSRSPSHDPMTGLAVALLTLPTPEPGRMLKRLAEHWKLSTAESRAVAAAIDHTPLLATAQTMAWSDLQPRLTDRDVWTSLATAEATFGPTEGVRRCRQELRREPEELDPPPLLTGGDLIALGHRPGPAFKDWLESARRAQLDGEISTRQAALDYLGLTSSNLPCEDP